MGKRMEQLGARNISGTICLLITILTNELQPFLLSCVIPESHKDLVPSSVSLVEHPCDAAKNNLKVIYDEPAVPNEKLKFGVCVKFLHGPKLDNSVRLTEWIETLHAIGADKIFLYELGVHPNVSKVKFSK